MTTDALALGDRERGHGLGQTSPGVLLRQVECVEGSVSLEVAFVPRPEYGLVHPRLSTAPGGVVAHGGATVIVLSTDLALQLEVGQARAIVGLHAGEVACFAVEQRSAWSGEVKAWGQRKIRNRLGRTSASWRSWSRLHQRYDGPLRDLVHQSGVVLQGLTFAPSGAVVAAPTTSLPEGVGSGRTWDYRYAWVRDASMTLQALFVSACPEEAARFFSYLATASATQLDRGLDLQIMFGIGGERDLSERELPHLSGWRNSSPVRVGNGAWSQRQLDVYGALMGSAFTLRDQLDDIAPDTRTFLGSVVDVAASRWQEKDQGIWEMRGEARSYVHSKLMCWVALERGVALAELLEVTAERVLGWERARDAVREAILTEGWNEQMGAFTQSFGSEELDASVLLMVIVGFLPTNDPRLLSTIDAIEGGLSDQRGLVYRYLGDDGIDSSEGTFLLCTFWLAHALAVTGQLDRAEATLRRAASYATDLGLLAEQIDPDTGDLLGNFPRHSAISGWSTPHRRWQRPGRGNTGQGAEPISLAITQYDDLDPRRVWRTVTREVPELRDYLVATVIPGLNDEQPVCSVAVRPSDEFMRNPVTTSKLPSKRSSQRAAGTLRRSVDRSGFRVSDPRTAGQHDPECQPPGHETGGPDGDRGHVILTGKSQPNLGQTTCCAPVPAWHYVPQCYLLGGAPPLRKAV